MAKAKKDAPASNPQSAFSALKRDRTTNLNKLNDELDKVNSSGPAPDPTYWSPTVDKTGNGYAVIRFLPAAEGEEVPFVRLFNHAFKGPTGAWYIENSLTTLGQQDPVSESNRELWATNTEENQKIVRQRKRKLNFISNVYVVKDAANPEAEGKSFKYKYGKKIWDKISDAMTGNEAEGVAGFNPFDLWDGATFKLRVRTVENFRNYDKSTFDEPGPLSDDDSELEAIWKSTHPLLPEIAADKFKDYDTLEAQFKRVIGAARSPRGPETPAPTQKAAESSKTPDGWGEDAEGDDSELRRFRALAED